MTIVVIVLLMISIPTLLFDRYIGLDTLDKLNYAGLLTLVNLAWVFGLLYFITSVLNKDKW
jgi:hypothetical protein